MSIAPGTSLLHYRIVDKLGEGGMGIVWRATDTNLDREVAIKVLPEALAAEPSCWPRSTTRASPRSTACTNTTLRQAQCASSRWNSSPERISP
jgi:serine/threonine protein kinase